MVGHEPQVILFFSFFFSFCFNCRVGLCMKKRRGIAAQRAEGPEDCVDGESVNGESNSVVRKQRS